MKGRRSLHRARRSGGFTLIELLAAVLIVATLSTLLFSSLQKATRAGERAKCASNLRQIGAAAMMYASEHDGYLPPGSRSAGPDAGNLIRLLAEYTSPMITPTMAPDLFYCPTNVRLGSPPAGGYAPNQYKGFGGYPTNFLINASIFLITNGDVNNSGYAPVGRVRLSSVLLPSKTVALSDMYTRLPTVTAPPASGLAKASYFDPKNASFFLGRVHNNLGNVLFVDGHVETISGANKVPVKSLPEQTTTWWPE
jgi:prepilin-type processing-associated H-X9-DG protein/prepilin-type N-terminal cleavage/methylation domain-containing protein